MSAYAVGDILKVRVVRRPIYARSDPPAAKESVKRVEVRSRVGSGELSVWEVGSRPPRYFRLSKDSMWGTRARYDVLEILPEPSRKVKGCQLLREAAAALTARSAEQAYAENRRGIDRSLRTIGSLLRTHEMDFQRQPTNRSAVGDLAHVLEQLLDIEAFLKGAK